MSRTIQQIEINGQAVWMEVEDLPVVSPPGGSEFADTSNQSGNAAVSAIRKINIGDTLAAVLTPVQAAFEKLKPEEVTIELTLGFKADASVFIASSEASAQIKISAKWKPAQKS